MWKLEDIGEQQLDEFEKLCNMDKLQDCMRYEWNHSANREGLEN